MTIARAHKQQEDWAVEESGVVVATEPLTVRLSGVERRARRAVSCLVSPRVGDEVLTSRLADGRAYVLAILERPEPGVELAVEGDCAIRATGELDLVARGGMGLATGEDLRVVAGRFSLKTIAGTIASETLELVSRAVTGEIGRAVVAARSLDGYFERVTQRAKRSIRVVEEADQLRAGRIDHMAAESMTLHADSAVVTARQVVKVDGGQIQLG